MPAYVRNADLYKELIKCKDASITHTEDLLVMFSKMSDKLSYKFRFYREADRKDCIQGGIIDAWSYWGSFDPSVSVNAFAYVTQIIKNGQSKAFRKIYPQYFKEGLDYKVLQHVSLSGNIWSL